MENKPPPPSLPKPGRSPSAALVALIVPDERGMEIIKKQYMKERLSEMDTHQTYTEKKNEQQG